MRTFERLKDKEIQDFLFKVLLLKEYLILEFTENSDDFRRELLEDNSVLEQVKWGMWKLLK